MKCDLCWETNRALAVLSVEVSDETVREYVERGMLPAGRVPEHIGLKITVRLCSACTRGAQLDQAAAYALLREFPVPP